MFAVRANAGGTPPPTTDGYVRYNDVSGRLTCTDGSPTSVDFGFRYNAQRLGDGSYPLIVGYSYVSGSSLSAEYGRATIDVKPGTRGTVHHVFELRHLSAENTSVLLSAHLHGDRFYPFAERSFALDCPADPPSTLVSPTVSVDPVTCNGVAALTFDGTESADEWQWVIYHPADKTFYVAGEGQYVEPGHTARAKYPGVSAGQVLSVHFNTGSGRVDAGLFTLRSGCPTVDVSADSIPTGATQHVSAVHFPANTKLSATLHSVPIDLGTHTTDAHGRLTFSFAIPTDLAAGHHTVTVTDPGTGKSGSASFLVAASSRALADTGPRDIGDQLTLALAAVALGTAVLLIGRRRRNAGA